MSRSRYNVNRRKDLVNKIFIASFVIIIVWFIVSIIMNKSPIALFDKSILKHSSLLGTNNNIGKTSTLIGKDSLISELKTQLAICKGEKTYKKARVNIESVFLNMRTQPSLNSKVIIHIPADAVIDVMYYDTKTYYIEGEPGQWCKVRYAEKEGWVWGNYVSVY